MQCRIIEETSKELSSESFSRTFGLEGFNMPMTVKVDTGALSKLIRSRGLQPGGRVQQVLTNEIYKQAEPYTPMRSKTLIRTAQVGKDHITYVQPYSNMDCIFLLFVHDTGRCRESLIYDLHLPAGR